jgi:hypothetical protein
VCELVQSEYRAPSIAAGQALFLGRCLATAANTLPIRQFPVGVNESGVAGADGGGVVAEQPGRDAINVLL